MPSHYLSWRAPVAEGGCNERRRFGYRRLFVLLRREGEPSGINRIHRLYREEGLAVRKRRAGARPWAFGCRSCWKQGRMRAGRWISSMTSLPTDGASAPQHRRRRHQGMPGRDPGHLDLRTACGAGTDRDRRAARKPGSIVSDNGTEFTCNAMLAWCKETSIDWPHAPGKPIRTGE